MKTNPRTTQMFFTLLAHRERSRERSDWRLGRIGGGDRPLWLASRHPKPISLPNPMQGRLQGDQPNEPVPGGFTAPFTSTPLGF